MIGSKAPYRESDYHFARARSDREWVELSKIPPMESTAEQAVGVLLMGLSGVAIIIVIAEIVRMFL